MLLLSDEAQISQRRDDELTSVRAETSEAKERVADLLDSLLRTHPTTKSQADAPPLDTTSQT